MTTLNAARPLHAPSDPAPAKAADQRAGCCSARCGCASGAAQQPPVALAADALLRQCSDFLASLADETYRAPSAILMGSTIGQHVRHSLDHFAAAVRAMQGEAIDYDHRERDTPVETSRAAALAAIDALRAPLRTIDAPAAAAAVRVRVMLSGDGAETDLGSTLAREIAFAAHHATHHHAMMAAIAKEHGVTPPAGFGKAPSTLNFERGRSA